MMKLFIVFFVCYGASALIENYWPEAQNRNVDIHNHHVSYFTIGIALAGIAAWKYKGK